MKTAAFAPLGIQVFGVAIVLFGDVGFDKPGRFGLDFGHLLLIAAAEVALFIALVVFSIVKKKWWPGVSSLVILGTGVALVLTFL
jgi:hypothetical protein